MGQSRWSPADIATPQMQMHFVQVVLSENVRNAYPSHSHGWPATRTNGGVSF
jgi:hypothetical protein